VPIVVLAEDGPLREDLEALDIEVHVRPLAVMRRALMSPAGMGRVAAAWAADAGGLGRLARTRGVSLVHTNTSVTLGGAAAARIAQVPHVWHVREIFAGFERWWPAYRRLLVTADALPCVSAATAAQFDGAGHVRVLPDGLAAFPERADRAAARAELGVPDGAFTVALLGRLSPWKGQDVLIDALADTRLREAGAVALIAGAPWRGEERRGRELRELADRLGVADRVRFLGFRDDVSTVLGAADVVAVPSTQPDPLPNAALEAGAAGCCVVAADHGGLPDMIRDGETGVLVPPADVGALATALAGLAADPDRCAALAGAAARDIPERFAPEHLLQRTQALYDELLG
jgi:glycosyltransferase involved in cell wall biosynthesis